MSFRETHDRSQIAMRFFSSESNSLLSFTALMINSLASTSYRLDFAFIHNDL